MLFAWIPEDMETKTSALIILLKEIIPMENRTMGFDPFLGSFSGTRIL